VFNRGSQYAAPVATLSDYLGAYKPAGIRTDAWRLNLTEAEVIKLFDLLRADYVLSSKETFLRYVGRQYNEVFYNCSQYACDKILESVDDREGIQGVLIDTVDAIAPSVFTQQTIDILRIVGLLGDAQRGLQAPGGAGRNVIIYWKSLLSKIAGQMASRGQKTGGEKPLGGGI